MSESKSQPTRLDEWINAIKQEDFQQHVSRLHKLHQLHFIARLNPHPSWPPALDHVPPAYRLPWIKEPYLSEPTQSKIEYVKANIVDAVTTGDWGDFLDELDRT